MHFLGADLHLERNAVRAKERRMQRLVAVDARYRDVVLEAARHGLEYAVYPADRAVTGIDVRDDDAQSVDIHYFIEKRALAPHLLVDAVEMLLAPLHARRALVPQKGGLQLPLDLLQKLLLVAARPLQRPLEHAVALRIQRAKPEILELEFDVVQTQALGDGRIDVDGFARNRAPPRWHHRLDGAHVVRAVRELDEDDAQIAHHREQHLSEALRLGFLATFEFDLVELGDAVDELGHVCTEARRELVLGGRG